MITVAGEALMDVLVDPSGGLRAVPGGAAFNVARMVARLGGDCRFLGPLSDDRFGRELRETLVGDGVGIAVERTSCAPTTLAIAEVGGSGSAEYRFYLEGTSAADLRPADVPARVFAGASAIAFGGLGILIEPTASTLRGLMPCIGEDTTVVLDPNGRPAMLDTYRRAVMTLLRRVDIVKVSVDDLRLLDLYADLERTARSLLAHGPRAVVVTDGPAPVRIYTAAGERSVPVPRAQVVDTIGAGDAFVAGLLTWWAGRSMPRAAAGDPETVLEAAAAAAPVAAAACTVRGAGLPEAFGMSAPGEVVGIRGGRRRAALP